MKTQHKPSRMPGPFTNFASSRFLDRERIVEEIREAAERLKSAHPGIQSIFLFGSFASGIPTPSSDADVLVVASVCDWEALQTEFLSVSVPVDCHVVTPDLFDRESGSGRGLSGVAARTGMQLA